MDILRLYSNDTLQEPRFEWDERKSQANLEKHGIDFGEARRLWEDRWRITFSISCSAERRQGTIAFYAGGCWTAIYTVRNGAHRIISVRRSTPKEVARYDKARNDRSGV